MTRPARLPLWSTAALLVAALTAAVPAAGAQPGPVPPPGPDAGHSTLDGALDAVGMDRAGFEQQAETAARLAAAGDEYAVRFPAAFAGVRIVEVRGQVGVIPGADGEGALVADARARGFSTFAAPTPARSLDRTADEVEAWVDSLPPAQRDEVSVTQVDPATGEVTVVLSDSGAAPVPPRDLDVRVRRDSFHKAQSSASAGGAPAPVDPTPIDPTPPVVPDGALMGGDRYLSTDPGTGRAAYCSLGFNGLRDGRVVNITATHCGAFPDAAGGPLRYGVVSEDFRTPRLGAFTAAESDVAMDAALITVDPGQADRFRNSLVHSSGGAPLAITGTATPVVGQAVCKYGQRSSYTCGTVRKLDSTRSPEQVTVDICALAGDSGGVFFAGSRALAVTSMSNAFHEDADGQLVGYPDCASAQAGLRTMNAFPQAIVVSVNAITARYPGLTVGAA